MKLLKILDWPSKQYYGETHHFHRWKKQLLNHGLKVEFHVDHRDKGLSDADYVLIHSRYFGKGWQNINKRNARNEEELFRFLLALRGSVDQLIWFDAADSTGSYDFPVLPYVDVFLKKQLLLNRDYYVNPEGGKDIRVWLNCLSPEERKRFEPCPPQELHKVRLGWNIGFNDYRYFGCKMSRLSNYLSYNLYPVRFADVYQQRPYDLAYRGTIHSDNEGQKGVFYQRNHLLSLFKEMNLQMATGANVSKTRYWKELKSSKLSVSPFGWGEICYRDFETFISGAVLVKPVMSHIETFPDLFIADETYVPVHWNLSGLEGQLTEIINNYPYYRTIARNGQEKYYEAINDAEKFISFFKQSIDNT